jgi:hypothetical protein
MRLAVVSLAGGADMGERAVGGRAGAVGVPVCADGAMGVERDAGVAVGGTGRWREGAFQRAGRFAGDWWWLTGQEPSD